MKRIFFALLVIVFGITSLTACAQNKKDDKNMNEKKILVAYFSWSGNTRHAAQYIANQLGADQFEIVRQKDYPTDYDPCTVEAKEEKERGDRPAIKGKVQNMDQYDVIFVGVPVWWFTAPMPVFTFLEQYDFAGKTIVPFCTCYTAEYQTLDDIVKATPNSKHFDGLTIVTTEMGGKGMKEKQSQIDKWLKSLNF